MHEFRSWRWSRFGEALRLVLAGLVAAFLSASPLRAQEASYTPPAGSAEREAIFDAMRKRGDNHDRVFVVQYLMVQNGWAWVVSDPQSRDGKSHYERESALLRKESAGWRVLDQPCTEADCDDKREMARIRMAYPNAPAGIFPR